MLSQGVVPVLLLTGTVTSIPSAGVGAVVEGPWGSLSCSRAPRIPRARWKYAEGVGRFDDVTGARARRKLLPEASISPKAFLRGSGVMEFVSHAASD
jgi:hypothetical protein